MGQMLPKRVLENLETILGIELLTASQAIEFRRPLLSILLKCF
jgi:histidine ammonia-lyase